MGNKTEVSSGEYGLFVRPAFEGDRINILYKLPLLPADGKISIYDERGKMVKDIKVNGMNGLISITVAEMGGPGMFNCVLTENGSIKYHARVMVRNAHLPGQW